MKQIKTENRKKRESLVKKKRKAAILTEAKKQFVEFGIEKSNMEHIASRVGVTRQTLYRYYKSKEELALAVEVEVLNSLLGRLNELFTSSSGLALPVMETIFNETVIQFIEEYEQELRYTAIFDTFFVEYSDKSQVKLMQEALAMHPNSFTEFISREQKQGNISPDLDPLLTGEMISNSMLALCQRVLLRREALHAEYGIDPIVLVPIQLKMFIRGLTY